MLIDLTVITWEKILKFQVVIFSPNCENEAQRKKPSELCI